jgi:hypothetical protein
MWTKAAEQLVMITAMQESRLVFLKQLNGPALGLWQIEPVTHQDLWTTWIRHRPQVARQVLMVTGVRTSDAAVWDVPDSFLYTNLAYGAAICRLLYRRHKEPLPAADDVAGLAAYWKQHYNTPLGAGTVEQFAASANKLPPSIVA